MFGVDQHQRGRKRDSQAQGAAQEPIHQALGEGRAVTEMQDGRADQRRTGRDGRCDRGQLGQSAKGSHPRRAVPEPAERRPDRAGLQSVHRGENQSLERPVACLQAHRHMEEDEHRDQNQAANACQGEQAGGQKGVGGPEGGDAQRRAGEVLAEHDRGGDRER